MDHSTLHAPALVAAPATAEPRINDITLAHPWRWLAKGWQDLLRARQYSLTYGAVVVLFSAVLTLGLAVEGLLFIVPFLAAGFYLLAPIVGLGLYQMSAHLERGEPLKFCQALEAWRRNQGQLALLTAALMIIMQLWMMVNFVLFALLYDGLYPPLDRFVETVFLSGHGNAFVLASVTVGFVLAGIAYAISAVSVPMLIDRKVDGLTAMRTSARAVLRNGRAMTLWAGLIVLLVGVGLLTFYVGLFVVMPLLGHATWHAYRDLVPTD